MSADSPRRSGNRTARQGGVSVCGNGGGQVVAPQTVTDPSIIESVTGFINDVVPQAYTNTLPGDCKDTITWARFESADINDPAFFPDSTSETVLPLVLILGYNTGVQVWTIPANGEATEVLSWSQGSVRTLRFLPSPNVNLSHSSDLYAIKRPLVAICDSAGPGPPFCSISFISLKTGDQVKSIKFKNPVSDVYANRRSVVVTFPERIAVFDACTLEDRLSITSCYLSPGPNANPVALGSRWLAFAEKKLVAWKRSSGGVGGAGAQSYTATVLHAAQTLGRGLRGLSETVASSLTGPRHHSGSQMSILGSSPPTINGTDHSSPGVVTVLDLEVSSHRCNGSDEGAANNTITADGVIAHFIAHNEAIVALEFDTSGTLLLTADRRGHDFHVFRLQPHPSGSSLAAVHHLYVLHRGDTSAKVQNVAFSCDSRWVAVSTLRGTTHVFPLTPYGGPVGFRTHGSPLVVNRLSRFHRSAGLSADGRSSPVPSPESPPCLPAGPHANPRLPPYPHPTVQSPLSQLRQSPHPHLAPAGTLDVSVKVCAAFASPRAWLLESQTTHPRDGPRDSTKVLRRPVDSLFVMGHHGNLVQYDLDPKPIIGDPREKICDDTKIELEVEAKAQWPLQRSSVSHEVLPPLSPSNLLLSGPELRMPPSDFETNGQLEERWLSQVEIVTHAGPHRRLWMGPQITFKTYTVTSPGSNVSLQDVEAVEVGTVPVSRPARSNPVNMPGGRPVVPVLIESGSGSSYEQSPHLLEVYGSDSGDADHWGGHGASRLREDLADAMMESPGVPSREKGKRRYCGLVGEGGGEVGVGGEGVGAGRGTVPVPAVPVRRVVNPGGAEITMRSDLEEPDMDQGQMVPVDPEHHWEAIAVPASAGLIPVPHDPAPDSDTDRQLVTTIAAALQHAEASHPAALPNAPSTRRDSVTVSFPEKATDVSEKLGSTVSSDFVTRKSSIGDGGMVRGKQIILEKDVEVLKKGSIKNDEPNKSAYGRGLDLTESSQARKKSKKVSKEVVSSVTSEANLKDEISSKTEPYTLSHDPETPEPLTKINEVIPVTSGKKGKKNGSSFDNLSTAVIQASTQASSRKSLSPPKEVAENKGVKRSSLPAEKETDDDTMMTSKKNKKKAAAMMKESQKKDEMITSGSMEIVKSTSLEIAQKSESDSIDPDPTISNDVQSGEKNSRNDILDIKYSYSGQHKGENDATLSLVESSCDEPQSPIDAMKTPNFKKYDVELSDSSKDLVETTSQTSTVSKTGRKAMKSKQTSYEESSHKNDYEMECSSTDKVERDLLPKSTMKRTSKTDSREGVNSEETVAVLPKRETAGHLKNKKSLNTQEQDSAPTIDSGTKNNVESDLQEAVLDDESSAVDIKENSKTKPKLEANVDIKSFMELDEVTSVGTKTGKRGSKASKVSHDDGGSGTMKNEHDSSVVPFEHITPNAWNIRSTLDKTENSENFPALSSQSSKRGWGKPSKDSPKSEGENVCVDQETPKTRRNGKTSDAVLPETITDSGVPKPKRGWEIPNTAKSPEMDIEKLTFEDLEAIVDAVCKEEETKIDQMCLKENKNGKKSEQTTLSHGQKTTGKENMEDEVTSIDVNSCSDTVEVIEVPKPVEDLIKAEEPAKAPEKSISTPNRSSKAHRRKRR